MGKKFLGLGGTDHFWDRAKAWILNQITSAVAAKIAEVVANAPEDLDTLKEIADWISAHANDAAAMNTQIQTNKDNIATNTSDISALNTQITENKNNIAANTSSISAMNTQITENKNNIAANTSDISALNTQITENKSNIAANSSSISAMNTQINTNKSDISALANLVNVVYEDITSECSAINNTVIVNAVYGYKQGNRVSLTFIVVTNGSPYAIIRIPQRYTTRNVDFSRQWWNYSVHNQSVIATTNQAGEFYVMYDTTVPAGVSFIQTFDYYI